jgi:chromosome segregation ATPase
MGQAAMAMNMDQIRAYLEAQEDRAKDLKQKNDETARELTEQKLLLDRTREAVEGAQAELAGVKANLLQAQGQLSAAQDLLTAIRQDTTRALEIRDDVAHHLNQSTTDLVTLQAKYRALAMQSPAEVPKSRHG